MQIGSNLPGDTCTVYCTIQPLKILYGSSYHILNRRFFCNIYFYCNSIATQFFYFIYCFLCSSFVNICNNYFAAFFCKTNRCSGSNARASAGY